MKKILAATILLAFSFCLHAQQPIIDTTIYHFEDSLLVPTRDGAEIVVTVVRKKSATVRQPAVLFYTTYYQGQRDAVLAKMSADHDYVGVLAYCRGIRSSLDYKPYENDAKDVYDVIDWITEQDWSNKKVGMYGGSYTGFVQWAAAKNPHPALKTIVPQVAVMPGFDFPMENNIPTSNILSWSNDNIYKRNPLPRNLNDEWYQKGLSFRSLDSLAGERNEIFQKWLRYPDYDAYWRSLAPIPQEYAKMQIPILATTGYYDGSQISAIQYAKRYLRVNKNPNLYFVIGPYDHWGAQRKPVAELMGYHVDSSALIDMRELAFQWMDYILKDGPKPALLKDRINYEVMGANEWRHAPSFEAIATDTLKLYLSEQKKNGLQQLVIKKPKKSIAVNQKVDFKDRTTQNNYFTPLIVLDSLDASNGIVYTSTPFDKPTVITGSFTGTLAASINKKDMDISITFYEQMPDGKYFYLTRYLGRASYAKESINRQLLSPGKKEMIPITPTRMISREFSKGSKLVIVLNINKHPYEVINYGTGKDVNDETIADAGEPLQIKWFNDSYIKVPIEK